MSWQVYSDLHLEFSKRIPQIPAEADNLILAGDITTSKHMKKLDELFKYCSNKWKHIYYICGNHEFYSGDDLNTLKSSYREACDKYDNVHFLDSEYIIIDGIAIYGFIGWTPLSKYIIEHGYDVLCDFELIKIGTSHLTPKMMIRMSNEELDKFKEFISKVNNEEILCESVIIVSHFPPIREGTSAPEYSNSELQPYFSWSNIMRNLSCPKIKVWVSGHTHWSYDFVKDGIRYFSNQIGYHTEKTRSGNGLFILNDGIF